MARSVGSPLRGDSGRCLNPGRSSAQDSTGNVFAFTKLLVDLPFFHPFDQAAQADGEAPAISASPRVGKASNATESHSTRRARWPIVLCLSAEARRSSFETTDERGRGHRHEAEGRAAA